MAFVQRLSLGFICILGLANCGGPSKAKRNYPAPEADELLAGLKKQQAPALSFMAESRMEYWANGERIKPTVLVMGERGAKVRFNALNPAGDDVAADLACDGQNFQYVDFNNNCQLEGLCNRDAISRLLGVTLRPDDFLMLAYGSTPILENAKASLRWDEKTQREALRLLAEDGSKQEIILEKSPLGWDVRSSTLWTPEGEIEWKLSNKDFKSKSDEKGQEFRLPGRTRFEQPAQKAELSIRWDERELNMSLAPEKFRMEMPEGLPRCGS